MHYSEEEIVETQEILVAAKKAESKLVPEKSNERYAKAYNAFKRFQGKNKTNSFSETTLLAYFYELSQQIFPSTLWSQYSMLKLMINISHNLNIVKYPNLVPFLKQNALGFRRKKLTFFLQKNCKNSFVMPQMKYTLHRR